MQSYARRAAPNSRQAVTAVGQPHPARIWLSAPNGLTSPGRDSVLQRKVKDYLGENDKRIEVILPNGKSIHLEVDRKDTVNDLRAYLVERFGWQTETVRIAEWVGADDPVGDDDELLPHLIYKAKIPVTDPSGKLGLASKIQRALLAAGCGVILGGGAAAAVLGSGRTVKDLDFKMTGELKTAYEKDAAMVVDAVGNAMRGADLSVAETEVNPYVMRFLVGDPAADIAGVEVSVTRTGSYAKREYVEVANDEDGSTTPLVLIGVVELLLDKLFAFSERAVNAVDKLATDFIDIVTLLQRDPQLYSPSVLTERLQGYSKKWKRETASRKQQAESKQKKGEVVREPTGYELLAPNVALQIAMRTSVVLHDSDLRERFGLRQLRSWIAKIGTIARTIQKLSRQ